MTIYLANAFSPSMLTLLPLDVEFTSVSVKEFCEVVNENPVNSIGHQGTVDLVNQLCGSNLKVNRISVQADIGDEIYIVTLMVRLEEGKILNREEVMRMYQEGKVRFVKAKIYGAVLEQLVSCENLCSEMEYDILAYKAKGG